MPLEDINCYMQIVEHLVAEITMHCSMSNEKNFCHLVETLIQIICLFILLYVPSKQINLQVHEPTLILPNSLLPPL